MGLKSPLSFTHKYRLLLGLIDWAYIQSGVFLWGVGL